MWIPDDRHLYKLLTDWGGFFGGAFALIAGFVAYRAGQNQAEATRRAAHDQIAANAEKDRSQAHALAVAVYPEILLIGVHRDRVYNIIMSNYKTIDPEANIFNLAFIEMDSVLDLKIVEPPLIRENGHRLFVMGDAGATIFQLLGVILQYNRLVESLAQQVTKRTPINLDELSGHLTTMETLVTLIEQQITTIHDQG